MAKRFIEDVLPLTELNKTAQTGGGIGSFNAMHPYFARRPLTASRAMTLAALVDAPTTESERKTLENLIIALSQNEWPDRPDLIEQAQSLIRQAHGGRAPKVLDPFAGGGSMPLEALRLGCEATALDLNPVAYLALIGSLVYPQKFGKPQGHINLKPTIKEARTGYNLDQLSSVLLDNSQPPTAQMEMPQIPSLENTGSRLVDDVRYWAGWVLTQAQARIGKCYTNDPDGAVPVAYLWAKTITCPYCHGEVPLIKRFWLYQGGERARGDEVAYRLNVDRGARTYTVEILHGALAGQSQPELGTMRGATIECIYCGMPSERIEIVAQGQTGRMAQHLLVVALSRPGERGRDFRPATDQDNVRYHRAEEFLAEAETEGFEFWGLDRLLSVIPDEPTPPERSRSVSIRLYGIDCWGKIFNQRQLLALLTLGKEIRNCKELISSQDKQYAQVVALYLEYILAKLITYNTTMSWWQVNRSTIAPTMARHDIQMTWDYAEANPLGGLST